MPLSGLLSRSEILNPINLPCKCEDYQLLGNIGELPPEECFLNLDEDNIHREEVFPIKGSGISNWGLHFDSNFESGNLARAEWIQRKFQSNQEIKEEYDLYMTEDNLGEMNGKAGWFFFRIQNMKTNRRYRFNICNFYQNKSPFEF